MAARSVFKLLTKTCSYKVKSACPASAAACTPVKHHEKSLRSFSHSPHQRRRSIFQRHLSRSLQNLGELRYTENEDEPYNSERSRQSFSAAPERDPAKEFKQVVKPDELDETNVVYELTEGSKSQQNFFDVVGYMKKLESTKLNHMFMHLQPSNLRPFGSSENLHEPENLRRKRLRITYPSVKEDTATKAVKTSEELVYKEYPGYDDSKRAAISEVKLDVSSKMNYSTSCLEKTRKSEEKLKKKLTFCTTKAKHSSFSSLNKKKEPKRRVSDSKIFDVDMDNKRLLRRMSDLQVKGRNSTRNIKKLTVGGSRSDVLCNSTRKCNTQTKPPSNPSSEAYITVKLKDLQEECGNTKKKTAKKISFGRLPKLVVPNCPCIEDLPLKQGKPFGRLKKRFDVPDRDNACEHIKTCDQPRADDNYVVKPKTLRAIKMVDCPCEEREMTDFVIRRLPKVKVPEPKRDYDICTRKFSCPPRSDDGLVKEKKVLPKLKINLCPCVEELPLKEMAPLKKLKPVKIKEPPKTCREDEKCDPKERADYDLVIKPKILPQINSECVCVEPPTMTEGKPLRRLLKVKVKEPSRVCPLSNVCTEPRADEHIKVGKKKLPKFVPQNCPCIEPEVPSAEVELKRLVPKYTPEEPPKICKKKLLCPPRADDGMKIEPKQLPVIEPKECPCEEVEIFDAPPLRRLQAKPVKEPERICKLARECTTPRSDENLEATKKKLPKLPPGNCPCIEAPTPLDVKPLNRLKKVHVESPKIVCHEEKQCDTPRADESLKVDKKTLPKLEAPDCPCIELPPPEDVKPLRRLRKVHIPEPQKVCPRDELCDDVHRADADDWLYWKRVEVKPADCTPNEDSNKRSYSTFTRRYYSTGLVLKDETFGFKYNLPRLPSTSLKDEGYNIIIDIQPSAPIILTQEPISIDLEPCPSHNVLKRSHSDPNNSVTFVIYKNNNFGQSKSLKEASSDVALAFNTSNRFISTCSTLCESSERVNPSQNQGRIRDKHLQPKYPVLPEKEHFIHIYPTDESIQTSAQRGRVVCRTREDEECVEKKGEETAEEEAEQGRICEEEKKIKYEEEKSPSLWERIVNYFKARPNCPSPEEFRKMRLKDKAEKAAAKAGLSLYDPKEMLRKSEKDLPKVITAQSKREECEK